MEKDGRFARGDARRQLILDAAVQVIALEGAGNLTHRAVAGKARISLASVTYHFPSIEELRTSVFEHAGERIGLAFRALIENADFHRDDIPEIVAEYGASLITARREETVAVFEMIVATAHNPELRPVIQFFDARLADLLEPYVGTRGRAAIVTAAIQGLILTALTLNTGEANLRAAIADLVSLFRQ